MSRYSVTVNVCGDQTTLDSILDVTAYNDDADVALEMAGEAASHGIAAFTRAERVKQAKTAQPPQKAIDPDPICGICNRTLENHSPSSHLFAPMFSDHA